MKRIIQSVMVCSLIFLVTSACSDDDTEMVLMGNVEGTLQGVDLRHGWWLAG